MRCLISGTARAASGTLTVTRTMSEPASTSSMHCCAVPLASAVSVIVIDWTTTGAPPPTTTEPTRTLTVWRRLATSEDDEERVVTFVSGRYLGAGTRSPQQTCRHDRITQ